jgi:hypothetical protein
VVAGCDGIVWGVAPGGLAECLSKAWVMSGRWAQHMCVSSTATCGTSSRGLEGWWIGEGEDEEFSHTTAWWSGSACNDTCASRESPVCSVKTRANLVK